MHALVIQSQGILSMHLNRAVKLHPRIHNGARIQGGAVISTAPRRGLSGQYTPSPLYALCLLNVLTA